MMKKLLFGTFLLIAIASIDSQGVPKQGGTLTDLINDIFTQSPDMDTTSEESVVTSTTTVRPPITTTTTKRTTTTEKDTRIDGDDDDFEDGNNSNLPNVSF